MTFSFFDNNSLNLSIIFCPCKLLNTLLNEISFSFKIPLKLLINNFSSNKFFSPHRYRSTNTGENFYLFGRGSMKKK